MKLIPAPNVSIASVRCMKWFLYKLLSGSWLYDFMLANMQQYLNCLVKHTKRREEGRERVVSSTFVWYVEHLIVYKRVIVLLVSASSCHCLHRRRRLKKLAKLKHFVFSSRTDARLLPLVHVWVSEWEG